MEEIIDDLLNHLSEAEELLSKSLSGICDDCEPVIDSVPLEHFGEPCEMQYQYCEPGGKCCRKSNEYDNISRFLDIVSNAERVIEIESEAVSA